MSSAAGAACSGGVKSVDIYGSALPACFSFGTHLSPEKQDRNVVTALKGADLWHQFYKVGTEMMITKSGRIFPSIVISVGGLHPDLKYTVALEFNPVDNARYRFINNSWLKFGEAEPHCEEMLKYVHPESPSTGKHWMASRISFNIKVTSNKNRKSGQVVCLNSMHKYTPRVVISHFVSKKNIVPIYTHDLVECSFIGVTVYQNDQVSQLKIDHNPYAKALSDTGSDNKSYAGGMSTNQWPPMSPLLSPYGTFSPDGQGSLLALSPAGASPVSQFNTSFANWETPPDSPTAATAMYHAPFSSTASPSPLLPDHCQIQSMCLMAQDSSPISPLLYSPTGYVPIPATAAAVHPAHHQLHPMQVSATTPQAPIPATAAAAHPAHHQLHPMQVSATTPQAPIPATAAAAHPTQRSCSSPRPPIPLHAGFCNYPSAFPGGDKQEN